MSIKLTENFRAVFYAPFYATQALGFYDREGVATTIAWIRAFIERSGLQDCTGQPQNANPFRRQNARHHHSRR
jgi:hypothetical protein